ILTPGENSDRRTVPVGLECIASELQCSICLELYTDAVTLRCGHKYCRQCITQHQRYPPRGANHQCPQCCRPFNCDSIITDYTINNMVQKIQQVMDRDVDEAKQLVAFEPSGSIVINEDILRSCFLAEDVKDRPLCLISIIGEERKGKSFLLNYLLRRLYNLERKDQQWLGAEDEDLKGFEWKPGANSTTKGVFIWSKPFLMETGRGKVAIFVVDSEGCNTVGQDTAFIVQLSALSMLLSSYLIFNISTKLKQTDLDYLEKLLDLAQQTGEAIDLDPIQ
ncbi:RING finger protein 112-like, partial [Rhincodon typus]|uniref:RING finger protein 112-like n=1 Tax=Rhincodon typus TaxID=259920 RepID=UPI00202E5AF9